jgi:uncharacterized protein (DUF2062 family)
MSLARLVRYRLVIPMLRSRQPPEHTARGIGAGVFWAFTPTLGIQTVAVIGTWSFLRRFCRWDSSLVQTLAWTWINNPLTMVPIYYLAFVTGRWMLGAGTGGGYEAFAALFSAASAAESWTARTAEAARLLGWPTLVGCLPWATGFGWLAYRWSLGLLRQRAETVRARRAIA